MVSSPTPQKKEPAAGAARRDRPAAMSLAIHLDGSVDSRFLLIKSLNQSNLHHPGFDMGTRAKATRLLGSERLTIASDPLHTNLYFPHGRDRSQIDLSRDDTTQQRKRLLIDGTMYPVTYITRI